MKQFLYIAILIALTTNCMSKKTESSATKEQPAADTLSATAQTVNTDSCSDGIFIKDAHAYNNYIIDNQGYILEKNMEFVKTLSYSDSMSVSKEHFKALTEQTTQSIDSLQKLCSFNGNTAFKNAGIELFTFYQQAWSEYGKLLETTDKKMWLKNFNNIQTNFNDKHSKTEKTLEENFMKAQSDFSDKYLLHVKNTLLHEQLDSMLYLK